MDINGNLYEEKYVSFIISNFKSIYLISYLKIGEVQIIFIVLENVF